MSDIDHWTTPSGYDLQRIYGTIGRTRDGRYITGYSYALVIDIPQVDRYDWIELSEAEFEALRAVSRNRYGKEVSG